MSFDSSGTFARTVGVVPGSPIWQGDATSGIKIRADRHDSHDQDLANGLSECLTRTGKGVPAVDIPWGSKKITNLANPVSPQDAATKDYADNPDPSTKSRWLAGADANGRLRFSSSSGVNGIEWSAIDMSLLGRLNDPNKTSKRLVFNNSVDGSSGIPGDVAVLDEIGNFNLNGRLTWNLSWDASQWRAIVPGYATSLHIDGGGLHLNTTAAPTVTDPYLVASLYEYFSAYSAGGSSIIALNKTAADVGAAGEHAVMINALRNGVQRWQMQLGTGHVESGADAGSLFYLQGFSDGGAGLGATYATRSGAWSFPSTLAVASTFNVGASFSVAAGGTVIGVNYQASSGVYAGSGAIISFRPNLATSTGLASINAAGDLTIDRYLTAKGVEERAGIAPASGGGQYINFDYLGGSGPLHAWVNTADLGTVTVSCDYRLKKDIQPLERTWDKVKALRPISYTRKDWVIHEGEGPGKETRLSRASNEVEWGFLAHELQETLLPSAATGKKDQEDVVQSPNFPAIIAALTSALQEAMARIEALEAGHIAVDPFSEQAS